MEFVQQQWSEILRGGWPLYAAAIVLALLAAIAIGSLAMRLFRARRRSGEEPQADLQVDLEQLGRQGPPLAGPQLECYNQPVRLALVVIAPLGRGTELPPEEETAKFLEQIVPGLGRMFGRDTPLVYRWPEQLSFQGFTRAFFANVRLPGNRGKGTPWCSAAGRIEYGGKMYAVGMALCAARDNSLSEYTIEREGGWLDLLRVRSPA